MHSPCRCEIQERPGEHSPLLFCLQWFRQGREFAAEGSQRRTQGCERHDTRAFRR
jgi:hypothetical protein